MLSGCEHHEERRKHPSATVIPSSLTVEDRQKNIQRRFEITQAQQAQQAQIEIPTEIDTRVQPEPKVEPEIYTHQKPNHRLHTTTSQGSNVETIAHDGHFFVFITKHSGGASIIHHPSCPCLINNEKEK